MQNAVIVAALALTDMIYVCIFNYPCFWTSSDIWSYKSCILSKFELPQVWWKSNEMYLQQNKTADATSNSGHKS